MRGKGFYAFFKDDFRFVRQIGFVSTVKFESITVNHS
jgi:hypothetical protein